MAVIDRRIPFGFSFSLVVAGALENLTAEISKDNGDFLPIAGVVTEKDLGFYGVALTAEDTDAKVISFRAYLSSGESFSCVIFTAERFVDSDGQYSDPSR